MADIKLTVSTNPNLRSPNIEAEAQWIWEKGPIYYALQAKPVNALPGCWVYFIGEGQLVARSRADDFVENLDLPVDELKTYTGEPSPTKRWSVMCSLMEIAAHPIFIRVLRAFGMSHPRTRSVLNMPLWLSLKFKSMF